MTRILSLLLLVFALGGAAPAPVPFATRVAATAEGGFVMGNPAAPVKLVEYASLTCSHCRDFHRDASAPLKRYLATGRVSYELRPYILNGPDLAAQVLARCDGARAYFTRADAFFRRQDEWTAAFGRADPKAQARFEAAPADQKLLVLAQIGGLDRFAAGLGLPAPRVRQCLTNQAAADRVVAITQSARGQGVQGTPTFFLNGTRLDTNVWAGIEPLIKAAIGR